MNPDNLSLSEIAETLGVTLSALSNWQKRHDDFPLPAESNGRRRTYRLADIKAFIARHDLQINRSRSKQAHPIWRTADLLRNYELHGVEAAIVVATFAEMWASRKALLVEISHSGKIPPQIWFIQTKQPSGNKNMSEIYTELPHSFKKVDESTFKQIADIWLKEDAPDVDSRKQISKDLFNFAIRGLDKFSASNSTSKSLSQLMDRIGRGANVLDIATGLGVVLNHMRGAHSQTGQDVNKTSIQFQQLLDAIHSESNRYLNCENSLTTFEEKWLNAFDVVICDPPLGRKNEFAQFKESDPRWTYFEQTNPQSDMDYWIQTVLAYLKPTGTEKPAPRGIVVSNDSWLFISGEQPMRKALIRSGQIEAVIRLGDGLANGTTVALNLIILRKSERPGAPVRLIDASSIGTVVRGLREFSESDISDIVHVLNADSAVIQADSNRTIFCRDVSFAELLENDSILLPRRYQPIEKRVVDPLSVLQELEDLLKSIEKKITMFSKSLEANKIKNEINNVSKSNLTGVRQVSIGETVANAAPFEILFKNRPQGTEWTRDDVLNTDIVICLIGPQIGVCMIGSDFVATGSNWSRIAQLRIKGNEISTDYLMAWLSNGDFKAQVERLAGGTVLRAISKKDLNRIIIPIPTLQIQGILGSIAGQVEILHKTTQDVAELNNEVNLRLKTLLSILITHVASYDQRDSNAP
jgi:predicted DNA-binding protein YlxM (UPF0122 family)